MTKYVATQDDYAEDPRDWNPDETIAIVRTCRFGTTDNVDDTAWRHFLDYCDGDEDSAVELCNRWSRIFGVGLIYELTSIVGYSQSDWWDVLSIRPETQTYSAVETFGQYLRGDVWKVCEYEESTCDHGETHLDWVDGMGGIYADDEESAIEQYKEQR